MSITAKLTTSGNSKAIRLSKDMLRISNLDDTIEIEVKPGQIVIRNRKHPRAGWREMIQREIKANGPIDMVDEYGDMAVENEATIADGLD